MKKKNTLLINCDMGEWDAPHLQNVDQEIMPYIDLCNIACAGHAGSIEIIRRTIEVAEINGVKVGAHPGYIDRENFGRMYQPSQSYQLTDLLKKQIDLFTNKCDEMHVTPFHIKPHGALYHACNHREEEMNVLINLVMERYSHLVLLVFPDSRLHKKAIEVGLEVMAESFIDRKYTDQLLLEERSKHGAVITSPDEALEQYNLLCNGEIIARQTEVKLKTQTACIHGDNPNVLDILQSIEKNG